MKDWFHVSDPNSANVNYSVSSPGTTVYVNVFVRDQAGNVTAYTDTPVEMNTPPALDIYVADTNSGGFKKMLKDRRNRKQKFFHHKPPKVLDVCQVPVPARLEKSYVGSR